MTENMTTLVTNLAAEVEKFNSGNKSAGTRARKICQDIKKEAQDVRIKIQDTKNAG
jgi:hypothetical protein